MPNMIRALLLVALSALTALAADISGTWKGTAETPNGTIERTFVFKVDGSKVTGETTSEFTGRSEIQNGKLEGDAISFTITANIQGTDVKLNYKGKITGEVIKFTVNGLNDMVIEYTAKKVS